jgi:ATP-dependent Clp protease ATP-binding subunit ClpC
MAGTQYRGAFEERILALLNQLKNSPDTVLFIDEAHLIMGAGSTDGDGMDLANLLKPALARGEIRCIGATTFKEYRKFVERDPAIERRFQMVRLEELSEEDTYKVLQSILPSLQRHHNVRISDRAVKSAVQLSIRYMPNRCLPDKAIDVLDQACARFRLKMLAAYNKAGMAENTMPPVKEIGVTPHEIRKVISRMIAVPIEEMTAEERLRLGAIEREIRARLIGQEEAVVKSVSAIKKSRAGLSDPNRPFAVLLFLGPSGVGKTQLAKLLATYLFGAPNHLITFDMSEYIEEHSLSRLLGAPPGYVGSEEEGRLTGAVKNTPFSILLFDEIEKAHPRIFDIFLPIFDEGRLKDSHGREVNFKNCIIILTSNIGAEILSHANAPDMRSALIEELRQHFRPEFINRIDDIIPFYPLVAEDIRSILNLEINSVRKRLRDKKFHLHVYQRAFQYLAEKGYRPEFGARELRRVVDKEITTPLSEMILNHKFQAGDTIAVMEENGKLVFNKETPSPVKPEQGKQAHS